MSYLELIVACLTLIAVVLPYFLQNKDKRSKLKNTVYLIELIKTKNSLEDLVSSKTVQESSVLSAKLKQSLDDINNEIHSERGKRLNTYLTLLISLEIFVIFSVLSSKIISDAKSLGLLFLEGVFESPTARIFLLLLVLLIAILICYRLLLVIPFFKRFKQMEYTLLGFGLFNLVLLLSTLMIYLILYVSDPFVIWY